MKRLVVASRNPGKVREIRELLAGNAEYEVVGLADLGIGESPEEDRLEDYATFEENALAKARYFADRTGAIALADDSGLCVDALGGAPGVRSRRFAPVEESRGEAQDRANNRFLGEQLRGIPPERRTAHYACAVAIAFPDGGELIRLGTCHGVILEEPRGSAGFGYDPLFYLPEQGRTFGEILPSVKNQISHRGRAVRAALEALRGG